MRVETDICIDWGWNFGNEPHFQAFASSNVPLFVFLQTIKYILPATPHNPILFCPFSTLIFGILYFFEPTRRLVIHIAFKRNSGDIRLSIELVKKENGYIFQTTHQKTHFKTNILFCLQI